MPKFVTDFEYRDVQTRWRGAHCPVHPKGSGSCHDCAMNCGWYGMAKKPKATGWSGPFATEDEAIAAAMGR